jgi:hypothetical protein
MKFKLNKLLSLMFAIVMMVSLGTTAFSSTSELTPSQVLSIENSVEISDANLEIYADAFGFDMETEDGYVLESITVTYECSDDTVGTQESNAGISTYGLFDYIGDVSLVSTDVYFPNDPLASNWFDGPMASVAMQFSQTFTGSFNCSITISGGSAEGELGFDYEESTSKTITATTQSITSSQRLNIKEYSVFNKYSFSVYNLFGTYQTSGYAYKPMGLYIAQAKYAK